MTKEQIHIICKQYNITNYTVNDDMSIDVNGDVVLSYRNLDKLPLRFRKVIGHFSCSSNKLISLQGAPIEVGKDFSCQHNILTTLEGCPIKVGGNFSCYKNNLISLLGCPDEIFGYFLCVENQLTSLKGCPRIVHHVFSCNNNKINTLEYGPEIVKNEFYCIDNPIHNEFKTKFNSDYNLYLKYIKRQKLLNKLLKYK